MTRPQGRWIGRIAAAAGAIALLAGASACAAGLRGPTPLTLRVLAYVAPPGASAGEVAGRIQAIQADYVILAADADSAWFREVATATTRSTTRPGGTESLTFAFLAGAALGDTTHVLTAGADRVTIHDALFQVTPQVNLDVIAFELEAPNGETRDVARALMSYVATDVPPQALIFLAVVSPPARPGGSLSQVLAPFFRDASTCESRLAESVTSVRFHIFYAPEARATCERATTTDDGAGLLLEIRTRG